MTSQVCASKNDIIRLGTFSFKLSQIIYVSAILSTFITSFFAIRIIHRKSIFQFSTKLLLYQNIFSANLHQIAYGLIAVERLHMAFFRLKDPCIPLKIESDCELHLEILIAGISGTIYAQTGLLIERAFATFMKNYTKKMSISIGCLISFIVFLTSSSTCRIIIWDDTQLDYQITCNTFPKGSIERSGIFFSIGTFLSLFNLLMAFLIRKYNQKFEYSTQFVVGPRFRKREMIDSTSTICFLACSQFIFIFIYSFGLYILKVLKNDLSFEQYYFWVVWINTIPIGSALLPVLLIYRIRYSHLARIMIIKKFTNTVQTQDDHIKQMKNIWN